GPKFGGGLIVASKRRRNEPRAGAARSRQKRGADDGAAWIWGWRSVLAALSAPEREGPRRLLASNERAERLAELGFGSFERVETTDLTRLLPPGAAHQGVALRLRPPDPTPLEALASPARGVLLMLDQITDPGNVGAIFRSAWTLGARGVVLQDRHAPPLAGGLAKAAAGAVERIAHARVVNLARALERLARLGWRSVGLEASAASELAEALDGGPTVLVLGSEGEGLRRLVAERCDGLARIAMAPGAESLNVAAAAAIALYEATRSQGRGA
ncbi:MAG: TrmH family RNA methyltransferase, partial [Caulobacteraceae bacterium]